MTTRYDFADPVAVSFCPACGLGFRIAQGRCDDCDADLVSRARALEEWRKSPPPDTAARSVFLCAAPNMVDAELIRATLEDAGIGFVTGDVSGVWGPQGGTEGLLTRYFVEERDLARALDALADVPQNDEDGPGTL